MFTIETTLDDITTAYRAADVSAKAAMRAEAKVAMKSALESGDMALALHVNALEDALTTAPKSAPVTDWTGRIRDLRATLLHAVSMIDNGDMTFPEGVTFDPTGIDFTGGNVDEKSAAKFAVVTGRKAGRGSVADYVFEALTHIAERDGDNGPSTVTELRAAWVPGMSSDYPKAAPSAGAIAAMLDRDNAESFRAVTVTRGGRSIIGAELA